LKVSRNVLSLLTEFGPPDTNARQQVSGRDFNAYANDIIALLPKQKLADLFDQKLKEDSDFKAAIEGIQSDEFQQIYAELWQTEEFLKEVQILGDNGIDMDVLLYQLVAIFGQN
jgi:hypothetical protein